MEAQGGVLQSPIAGAEASGEGGDDRGRRMMKAIFCRSELGFQIDNNRESLKSYKERSCVICLNFGKDCFASSIESGSERTRTGCGEI